jgi:hypothetical protein
MFHAGFLLGCAWLALTLGLGAESAAPINLAEFGRLSVADRTNPAVRVDVSALAGEKAAPVAVVPDNALVLEWTHARPVRAVHLRFEGGPPRAEEVAIQWWRRIWPDNGSGGWMKLDDPFNGQWTAVRATAATNGAELRFQFAPLDRAEAPGIGRTGMVHRLTYKLRMLCAQTVSVTHVGAYSDALARRARLRFEWNVNTTVPGDWSPKFEARNGRILKTSKAGRQAALLEVEYADAADRLSPDRGYVICRSGETRSFAVFVDDVLREGVLFVRDIGALVSDADKGFAFKEPPSAPAEEAWPEGTVAEQVAKLPEQSFEQVQRAIPPKPPQYLFLGVPNLRQEIALHPKGDIQLRADALRSPGPDAGLRPWPWEDLRYQFGTGAQPIMGPGDTRRVTRSLEEGWLPVVRHEWETEGIAWTQTCLACPLVDDIATLASRTGTEPVALVTRFEFRNPAPEPRTAWLWLELNHPLPCRLAVDGMLLLNRPSAGPERPGVAPVRGRFNIFGKGALDLAVLVPGGPGSYNPELKNSSAARQAVRYRLDLAPNEAHAIEFAVPYVELLDAKETAALKALAFTNAHASVVKFWKSRLAQGMTYEVPEPFLNHLFKANLWHVLISTDIDPITGQHQHGAATHGYRNFLNETAMVARSLEMRGEHDAALKLLETFLANQGVKGLPGNFKTKDGVLYAAHPTEPDPYTAQGYNMHHGWGLWLAAEHYYFTRDNDYLRRWAPQLVKAGDWVTRERQATKLKNPDGSRPVEFGLAPAGDLEDVEEYLYYYATDAYYYLGMKRVAAALAKAAATTRNNADAPARQALARAASRLALDADGFLRDIQASVAESVATSPVVRLKDGAYVPFVPPRAYALTHLKEGWIREGLYPALHLLNAQVYDERHPFADWMIQDLEDNIFLSQESGYGLQNQKTNFFNFGGFTLQPDLLDLAIVYLRRDQVPNFIRAFYNTAWASLYPDVMCFAEWVPAYGRGGGPLYKTPDECKFIQWMRQMLVLERGEALELGLGVPRAWMADGQRVKLERAATCFGKLDLELNSQAAAGAALASVRLAPTEPPKAIRLRLRHPEGRPLRSATVNGKPATLDQARQLIELPAGVSTWQVKGSF